MQKVKDRVKERKRKETYLTMFNVRGSPNYNKFEEQPSAPIGMSPEYSAGNQALQL